MGGAAVAADLTLVQSLQQGSQLVTVDSAAPATVRRTVAISGLPTGARLIGFDARPAAARALYGLANTGQVYAINGITGVATPLGAPLPLTGFPANTGFDFNPSVDRIRIVTDADQNFRVNPDTGGIAATDAMVAYAPGDSGAGVNPNVTGAAYTNNVAGGAPTTLYVVDSNRGVLATQGSVNGAPVSPNGGQLFTVGATGVPAGASTGFDIAGDGETVALFSDPATGDAALYRINLATGAATRISAFAPGARFTGLAFTQRPLALTGRTANEAAVGDAIDRFTGIPTGDLTRLLGVFDPLTDEARADALALLGPQAFSLAPQFAFQSANAAEQTVRRYLRDVRGGGTDAGAGGATMGANRKVGLFLTGNGRTGAFQSDVDRYRTSYSGAAVTGGLDYRLTPTILFGAFGGYDAGQARINPLSRHSDIDTWYAGGYGTVGVGPFYIDALGSYGRSQFSLRRFVAIGSYLADASSSSESENWQVAGTIGASFQIGGFEVEPYGGARYVHVDLDDFSEGVGLTALTVSGQERESFQSIAGLRLGLDFEVRGATVRPSIRGEWRHEFENDEPETLVARFGGAAIGTPFLFTPTLLDEDYAAVGAGFTVSGASPVSVVVDYNGEIGPDRTIHGITGGMRLSF